MTEEILSIDDAVASLSMVYQPIVDLQTGDVVGYEALARFLAEPQRPPDVWFAEARSQGLGVELELYAVEAALSVSPSLLGDRHISVNVSPPTLCDDRLREIVAPRAASTRVILELTEHESIEDYPSLIEATDRLRAAGLTIAVDDAGAGFASMRHILKLRPEMIKLDRSLIEEIVDDSTIRAFVLALGSFATAAGTQLCAEGIETAGEAAVLAELGVPLGQGYHLGRPGPLTV